MLEIKDRTTISSSTTLPQNEHDYEAALTFMLSESTRLTGQLRREKMQAREFSVAVRFNDFTEVSGTVTVSRSAISEFRHQRGRWKKCFVTSWPASGKSGAADSDCNFQSSKLDTHPTLWGQTHEERWGAVDDATHKLNEQLGKTVLMTGAQFASGKWMRRKEPEGEMSVHAAAGSGKRTLGQQSFRG